MAGIKPPGEDVQNPEGLNFTYLSGNESTQQAQKDVLKEAYNGMVGTAGVVSRYNTTAWVYTTGPYQSAENILVADADINSNGYLVVAESSLEKSGRIITVDNFGNVTSSLLEGILGMVTDINVESSLTTVST